MKPILPTLKENPRYILFRIKSSSKFSKKDAEKNIMFDCKKFLGELGIGKAGITFMKFDKKYQLGIIRTNSKYLDETKTALTLIKKLSSINAKVDVLKVSGIINKLHIETFKKT
jgi:RNase P/RNase MRP subunit POP5